MGQLINKVCVVNERTRVYENSKNIPTYSLHSHCSYFIPITAAAATATSTVRDQDDNQTAFYNSSALSILNH